MEGTRITLRLGGEKIAATLNDTPTARAFVRRLPLSMRVCGTGIDACGKLPCALPYEQAQVGRGWRNGDINYNPRGGWLAIFFDDEENSLRYGDQVNIGRVTSPLEELRALGGVKELTIEKAVPGAADAPDALGLLAEKPVA